MRNKGWGYRSILIFLTLVLFTQCQKPMNVLTRDKMLAVTKDMVLTEAYLKTRYQPDSIASLYYESVLEKHGISKEKYDSSLVWYGEHSHRLDRIYEEVEKMLMAEKLELDTLYSDSVAMERIRFAPTESLWKGPNRLFLSAKQNLFYFDQSISLDDDDFSPRDTIEWYATISPEQYLDSLDIKIYLLILNEDSHYYSRHKSIVVPDSLHALRHLISLPDSLPENGTATLYFVLQKTHDDLFLERFSLSRKEYIEPEEVDSLSTVNESDSTRMDEPKPLEEETLERDTLESSAFDQPAEMGVS